MELSMGRQGCWGVKNGVTMAAMAVVVMVAGALSVGAARRPLQLIRVPGGEADELCGKTESKYGFREDDSESDGGDSAAAVFVMGASYMDVGENFAAMPFRTSADFAPYGMDYFGAPTGRHSNGRLIIDHICELSIHLPSYNLTSYHPPFRLSNRFLSTDSCNYVRSTRSVLSGRTNSFCSQIHFFGKQEFRLQLRSICNWYGEAGSRTSALVLRLCHGGSSIKDRSFY